MFDVSAFDTQDAIGCLPLRCAYTAPASPPRPPQGISRDEQEAVGFYFMVRFCSRSTLSTPNPMVDHGLLFFYNLFWTKRRRPPVGSVVFLMFTKILACCLAAGCYIPGTNLIMNVVLFDAFDDILSAG